MKRKQNKKMKRKEKRKKTFSPGSYYEPGLKVPTIVACQQTPLLPVGPPLVPDPNPGLKDPL